MTYVPPPINEHAAKANNASRLLGILMIICGVLVVVAVGALLPRNASSAAKAFAFGVGGFYLVFGIAFFALGGALKAGSRGPTIATMILAICCAALFGLGTLSNLLMSAGNPNLIAIGIGGLLALIAGLLAAYCAKSLAFIKQWSAPRGFAPVLPAQPSTPVATPVQPPPPFRK